MRQLNKKKKPDRRCVSQTFYDLVLVAFSCRFSLLAALYRRGFVEFLPAEIADYAVARALSFEPFDSAFNGLVFAYSYGGHTSFQPSFAYAFITPAFWGAFVL